MVILSLVIGSSFPTAKSVLHRSSGAVAKMIARWKVGRIMSNLAPKHPFVFIPAPKAERLTSELVIKTVLMRLLILAWHLKFSAWATAFTTQPGLIT